jgi:hypothetical protein
MAEHWFVGCLGKGRIVEKQECSCEVCKPNAWVKSCAELMEGRWDMSFQKKKKNGAIGAGNIYIILAYAPY